MFNSFMFLCIRTTNMWVQTTFILQYIDNTEVTFYNNTQKHINILSKYKPKL